MKLTDAQQTLLDATAADAGMEYRDDYSGRFMYGEKCIAVIGKQNAFARFMMLVAQRDGELAGKLADSVRVDDMGLDLVYYFPGLQV